jgi:hypothetical protein
MAKRTLLLEFSLAPHFEPNNAFDSSITSSKYAEQTSGPTFSFLTLTLAQMECLREGS